MVWCCEGREGMCEEVWSVSNPSKIFFRTTYTAEKFHGKKSDTNLRSAFRAFLTCFPDGAPRSDREIDQRALSNTSHGPLMRCSVVRGGSCTPTPRPFFSSSGLLVIVSHSTITNYAAVSLDATFNFLRPLISPDAPFDIRRHGRPGSRRCCPPDRCPE